MSEGLAQSLVTNTYSANDNTITHYYGGSEKAPKKKKKQKQKGKK